MYYFAGLLSFRKKNTPMSLGIFRQDLRKWSLNQRSKFPVSRLAAFGSALGTHVASISRGYFTHILWGCKTFIFHDFWGAKVGTVLQRFVSATLVVQFLVGELQIEAHKHPLKKIKKAMFTKCFLFKKHKFKKRHYECYFLMKHLKFP